jgi:Fe-S oxidoreductase
MKYSEILHRCFRCGYCKLPGSYQDLNCPAYLKFRFESFSPGGRMWLLRAWLEGEIKTSPRLAQIMFSCATCGNCVEHCAFPKFKDDLLNAFIAGRECLVEEGAVPPEVRDFLKAANLYGNPYKLPQEDRGKWAEGLGLEQWNGQEYLFYAGCVGSYDERGQNMARSVASLLKDLGVSFGILGVEERCEGNEVLCLGERALFERMAGENIAGFEKAGIRKIITLSPHSFHALRNEYPGLGADLEVLHYSQVLSGMAGKAGSGTGGDKVAVCFHDPCYLGRHNDEYRAPRKVLKALPGVTLVEMSRVRQDALCCGGGGGNFFTDILGTGPDSPARVRAREAVETGARIIAVACPNCAKMLEDALKAEDLDEDLSVMDLAELVRARSTSA